MSAPPSEMTLRLPLRSVRTSATRTAPLSVWHSRHRRLALGGAFLVIVDVVLRLTDTGGTVVPQVTWASAAACFVASFAISMGETQ